MYVGQKFTEHIKNTKNLIFTWKTAILDTFACTKIILEGFALLRARAGPIWGFGWLRGVFRHLNAKPRRIMWKLY